ncbi:MAG: 16S rRNA (adenine(1518)-N(6)/adenine(1519)-N(6))-dimethyltransferase RsmA [Candidatus Vogelbacteria bacterium]
MIKAKKSLGQHFLTDQTALATIIATANLKVGETALEIGPGEGFLTGALLTTGAQVIAVEKDDRLIGVLTKKFSEKINSGQLILIHDDIINFLKAKTYKLEASYKLIANIPYYLTGQIVRQFLTVDNQPTSMILMIQKEVAERIVAKNNKESLLSISVKAYGTPHYIRTVPRGAFRPAPKVDSAIILIDKISKNNFREVSEEKFFALLHLGFASKRKMLRAKLGLTTEELASCGVNPQARAENLTVSQWFCLAKQISVPHP